MYHGLDIPLTLDIGDVGSVFRRDSYPAEHSLEVRSNCERAHAEPNE